MRWLLAATALVGSWFFSPAAYAQEYVYCPPGDVPQYMFGFAALEVQLGDVMGEPTTCEYGDPNASGDTLQLTTQGLAYYRKSTNTPTFTNGATHWGLAGGRLVEWSGGSVDPPGTLVVEELPERVIELTNLERERGGLLALEPRSSLQAAAQAYARVLAAGDCFAHTCGPVPELAERIGEVGYAGWIRVGENIAAGQRGPEAVVAAWMASPGHRANILSPNYTEIGVGHVAGGPYGLYWVQVFGARRP